MRIPHYVRLYVHNAKTPRAYQIALLRRGKDPKCYGFYTYLAYINREHRATPKTQTQVKKDLRMIRSNYPL